MLKRLRASATDGQLRQRLACRTAPARRFRIVRDATVGSVEAFWRRLRAETAASADDEAALADPATRASLTRYAANIENMIGTVKLPVGLAGPLRINGTHANGDYLVPLATTEAALVASYARGAEIITAAGGASAALAHDGVWRSPGFAFGSLLDAGLFIEWVAGNAAALKAAAESTTRHGKLVALEPVIDDNVVFLLCRYETGDAAGQNMVTIATDALCRHLVAHVPVKPLYWFIEANLSGDKKASYLGMVRGRGRKVTASVVLERALVERRLHTTVERMLDYARMANLGALLSGQMGAQGHYANGLAALYLATGQDAACVAESAVGYTRMEGHNGDLRVSVTLPNILVGSVGGGTGLPSQSAGLAILGLAGTGKAAALAEVAAVLCLAGEISIIGAIAAGHFARAHELLARRR
ncbi:MAG: hydroxymethylglutaryl-CoA reductase [Hyphomicrobiaceae bacterium]